MKQYLKTICMTFFLVIGYIGMAAAAPAPVPPGFSTAAQLEQPDVYPLRSVSFTATKEDKRAPGQSISIQYSYQGMLMDVPMVDAGYVETLQKDIRNEENRISKEQYYIGKKNLGEGTLFLVRVPPRPNEMSGPGYEEYYNAVYYEKVGRGMLQIRLNSVVGGRRSSHKSY